MNVVYIQKNKATFHIHIVQFKPSLEWLENSTRTPGDFKTIDLGIKKKKN